MKELKRGTMPPPKGDKADTKEQSPAQDTPSDAVESRTLKRHRWKKRYRRLLWLLVLIPLGYIAVQVFIILAPQLRTEVVLPQEMTDSVSVTGQVVMQSTPVEGGSAHLYYTVPVGQRVSAGAQVAQRFSSSQAVLAQDRLQAIALEMDMLNEAQQTTAEAGDLEVLLSEMQEGVQGMLQGIEAGDYAGTDIPLNEATLAANKLQIATNQVQNFQGRIDELTQERAYYESIAQVQADIQAPATGYFVPSMQNDRLQQDYEAVSKMSPQELQELLAAQPQYYGESVAGHIITDHRWSFFAVMSSEDAQKFAEGDTGLQLSFPDAGGESLPVSVQSVQQDEEQGIAVVELYCEYVSPEILTLRVEKAEIILGTQKGLQIDKNALRLVDVEDEDGLVVTYKGVYVQFGNMVYFRRVDVLLEDEFYMLVPDVYTEGVNEVRMYDTVVVDTGGIELYDQKIL